VHSNAAHRVQNVTFDWIDYFCELGRKSVHKKNNAANANSTHK